VQVFTAARSLYSCISNSSCLNYLKALVKVVKASCQTSVVKSAYKSTLPKVLCSSLSKYSPTRIQSGCRAVKDMKDCCVI